MIVWLETLGIPISKSEMEHPDFVAGCLWIYMDLQSTVDIHRQVNLTAVRKILKKPLGCTSCVETYVIPRLQLQFSSAREGQLWVLTRTHPSGAFWSGEADSYGLESPQVFKVYR